MFSQGSNRSEKTFLGAPALVSTPQQTRMSGLGKEQRKVHNRLRLQVSQDLIRKQVQTLRGPAAVLRKSVLKWPLNSFCQKRRLREGERQAQSQKTCLREFRVTVNGASG